MNDLNPTLIIIFGAAGDLTWRKLVPALYNLYLADWLPEKFRIIGLDRQEMNRQQFADRLRDGIRQFSRQGLADETTWAKFMRVDQIETAWGLVMPILDRWAADGKDLAGYKAGTWGPETAEKLVAQDGHRWLAP